MNRESDPGPADSEAIVPPPDNEGIVLGDDLGKGPCLSAVAEYDIRCDRKMNGIKNILNIIRAAVAGIILTGASSFALTGGEEAAMSMELTSPAFADGGGIPALYTCEGKDISPPLSWSGVPEGTVSLVLIVDDPDAPDPKAPKTVWVHWVLCNIPPTATGLPEGARTNQLPPGTEAGINDWKKTGYGGPAPPIGRHRYFHTLYALDVELKGLKHPTKAQVLKAMEGHVIARAELIGTYQRSR